MHIRFLGFAVALACLAAAMPTTAAANTVAGGAGHTAVVKPDGTVWTFGDNANGQLGDGTTTDRRVPVLVATITDAVAVAAGAYHTLVLRADGTVLSWGYNGNGQLGDGTTTQRTSPVTVIGLTNVIAIAAGNNFSVALTSDGRVWTWGQNSNGQLGIGSTTGSTQAVVVSSLAGISAVGAGQSHTLAVKSDGTVWSWGLNSSGQLGDGSTTQRTSPVQMTGVTSASAVAGGAFHSLILKTDGTMCAVGGNSSTQLGDGTGTQRTTSVAVSNLTNVIQIAAGTTSSYALKSDGTLWAWGANIFGKLGDGTTTNRSTATQLTSLASISLFGAGQDHALAVTSTGIVYSWGYNAKGQLGDGTTLERWTPIAISGANYDWKVSTPVFSVAAGTYTTEKTVVVTAATPDAFIHYTLNGDVPTETDASVTSGGSVQIDQTRTLKAKAFKSGMPPSDVTTAVYTLSVAAVSFSPTPSTYTAAQTVTLSTTSPGAVIRYTLDGSTPTPSSAQYSTPLSIGTTTTIKAIGMRTNWTSSAVATGMYTMNFGTLGPPTFSPAPGTYDNDVTLTLSAQSGATIRYATAPTTVTPSSPAYTSPLAITATTTINARAYHPDYTSSAQSSGAYTLVVATPTLSHVGGTYPAGQVVTVSSPTQGAVLRYTLNGATPTTNDPIVPASGLVIGNFTLKVAGWKTGYTPTSVVSANYQVTGTVTPPRIEAGDTYSLAVRSDGTVWAWGANGGRLGDGTMTQRLLPVLVNVSGIVDVSASAHALARRTDGSSASWGSNTNGQLGDGSTTLRTSPVPMTAVTQAVTMATGGSHTLTLKSDGTVWSFGRNWEGQLGDGTTTDRLAAVPASGLSSVSAIGAGSTHSVALRADGTVWTWGQNANGQLGTGNTTNRSTPGQISLTSVASMSVGNNHTLAILTDGTVRAWGGLGFGELGNGSTSGSTSPVVVSGLTSVAAVAGGAFHSLALKTDGSVWAWGQNSSGQLGDGTTTLRTTPVAVQGLPAIAVIAAGNTHSLAIDVDGGVWAWGNNASGQLGDGTTTNRSTPVQIANAGMVWKVATPVLSVASGLYYLDQTVTVTCTDSDAVLRYTTTGATPTDADTVIASGGTVAIPQSLTLKVRAFKPGAVMSEVATGTYELKAVAPALTPATGNYASAQTVGMTTTTTSATIRYTLDGTEPLPASAVYTGTITVSDTRTVKARAYKTGRTPSDSSASSYVIYAGTVSTPTITPAAGSFTSTPLVTLATTTAGATIRYSTDGSDPTLASSPYVFPFLIDRTTTVKARAFLAGWQPSAVSSAAYSLDVTNQTAPPTILPAGGRFATKQIVTITGPAGAPLHYTTTGVDPTTTDPLVPAGGTITVDRAQIIKVRAWVAGSLPSAVRRADFWITGAVAVGNSHSLGLASDGTLWAWGLGTSGQIGNGTAPANSPPVAVLTDVVSVDGGSTFSLAARQDGTVWGWGSNGNGQLGDGTTTGRLSPTQTLGLTNVIAVAAGADHALALKADGTVWAWGANASGQLGDGTTIQRTSPVQVLGLSGITSIAASEGFSVAVQADGAGGGFVWTWGLNADGQLGDGSTLTRVVPVRVPGLTTAVRVSAGRGFCVVLLADGSARAWGANGSGELANLAGGISTTPIPVPMLANVSHTISAMRHALALDSDGRVFGWGWNVDGQLGIAQYIGAEAQAFGAPVLIPSATDSIDAATGFSHSLVLRPDGTVGATGSAPASGLAANVTSFESIPALSLAPNAWLLTDGDGDGLAAWREYLAGLDPLNRDTNGNGLSDLVDLRRQSQSANPDDDGDGVPNAIERANGTDPFAADTDGDGASDLLDDYPLDPTRTQKPAPNPTDTTPPTIILTLPTNARPVGGGL